MKIKITKSIFQFCSIFFLAIFISIASADDNKYSQSTYGSIGLIEMPTARFSADGEFLFGISTEDPYSRLFSKVQFFPWMEAVVRYTEGTYKPYNAGSPQTWKDKGIDLKFRITEESEILPQIALGFTDIGGTGAFSSEYIAASKSINNIDLTLGLGWGRLGGVDHLNNIAGWLDSNRNIRGGYSVRGGTINLGRFFSGKNTSVFGGIEYFTSIPNLSLKLEYDSSERPGLVPFYYPKEDFNLGFDYSITNNLSIGVSYERGQYTSVKFVYKNNPSNNTRTYEESEYVRGSRRRGDNKYTQLINNLEENGIGVKRLSENANSIGLQLTQFVHPNLKVVQDIIDKSARDAGITKEIKTDIEIANLLAVSELDDAYRRTASTIYERSSGRRYTTNTRLQFRPFIASREEFFRGALLVENDTEFVLRENLFFNTNLKYSVWDNFEVLYIPPVDTFPAQVRSDVKEYLNKMNDGGVLIGRAQFDYHLTPVINHHIMVSAGIFEDMFSGAGAEYLYFKPDTNYAFGVDIFKVRKRDYSWRWGHLDYENVAATANFYWRNYGTIPFDMRISAGEYLAGDVGYTLELSRSFYNGVQFGAFATFTDVTVEQFGEGSFDKGIFFNIPIYGNLISYTWRPLTKDPGAKLNRRHTLYGLLVRLRPIE